MIYYRTHRTIIGIFEDTITYGPWHIMNDDNDLTWCGVRPQYAGSRRKTDIPSTDRVCAKCKKQAPLKQQTAWRSR